MDSTIDLIMKLDPATKVALVSVIVSIFTMISTSFFNYKTRKQYLDSLKPLLSFRLIEYNHCLYLTITNTGTVEAKNIRVTIDELGNNGNKENIYIDNLFENSFELYPNETVQGMVGIYGQTISNNTFPFVKTTIKYNEGNKKKSTVYSRMISFTTAHENKIFAKIDFDTFGIVDNLNSIAYSNNRVANYLEGRSLFVMDRLNVISKSSLYKDMRNAVINFDKKEKPIKKG
ncbi:MAG: hypothetical protein PHD15_07450 [Clostridia bacterium]|nr:hypothetical protein [Clostridia bacterium]